MNTGLNHFQDNNRRGGTQATEIKTLVTVIMVMVAIMIMITVVNLIALFFYVPGTNLCIYYERNNLLLTTLLL